MLTESLFFFKFKLTRVFLFLASGSSGRVDAGSVQALSQHASALVTFLVTRQAIQLKLLGISCLALLYSSSVGVRASIGERFGVENRVGEAVVKVDNHVHKEEQKRRKREQDENVRNAVHSGLSDEVHLLFGGAHE